MNTRGVLLGLLLSPAAWALDLVPESSTIQFLSVKKASIAEVGSFTRFSGVLTEQGGLQLSIDLSSVDTHVDIRDERLRNSLFETEKFPAAQVVARVDMALLRSLASGEERLIEVPGSVSLHGVTVDVEVSVLVTGLADGSLRAVTTRPVVLSLDDFGMKEGVEKLQELAGLPSINLVTPVFLSLHFR